MEDLARVRYDNQSYILNLNTFTIEFKISGNVKLEILDNWKFLPVP